jgi:hypothetical protein
MAINLNNIIDKQIKILKAHITETKRERDNAATAMESHSDQTRQIKDQLFHALEEKLQNLLKIKKSLTNKHTFSNKAELNTLVTLQSSSGISKYLLVPEGLGGLKEEDVFLLSISSPFAQNILHQKINYKFNFNQIDYLITDIIPNTP